MLLLGVLCGIGGDQDVSTVFVSYRRSDTTGEAARLAETLGRKLGNRFVFRDVVSISPGDRWDAVLETELAAAKVVLVLIGTEWLEELKRRLPKGEADFHRVEVATALKGRKRVIPVLVRGAALPHPKVLPDDLTEITKHQALTIQDESWTADLERLIDAIGRPYRWDLLLARTLIAVVAIILTVWKLTPLVAPELTADYGFLRAVALTLLAIYGFTEFTVAYRHFQKLRRLRAQ